MPGKESLIKVLAQVVRIFRGVLASEREVRVRLREDVEATIYDRPGLWMDDARLGRLQDDIARVASAAVPGQLRYGVLLRERRPFENRLIVIGRRPPASPGDGEGAEILGFNALPWLEVRLPRRTVTVMHMGLLIIHPRHQRQGLQGLLYCLGAFNAYHRAKQRPVWVSNVTEVPAVFGAVCDQFAGPHPHYARRGAAPPPGYRELAAAIFAQHRQEFGVGPEARFDDQRFVITGSYTGGSEALKKERDKAPRYRVEACNDFCRAELDYARGDDFLQICQMDATVITNWLTRRIPADLRPTLARQMKLWTYPAAARPEERAG
jgi:hypothetical protein